MTLDIEKVAENEVLSSLKQLGLATYEATTFHTLITHSELKAADLCSKTGIPDSKIYHTLNTLEQRGMITVQRGRPSLFKALPPDEAMANLKRVLEEDHSQKMGMLDALTIKMSEMYEGVESREEMELGYVIRGISGILSKMNTLIDQAQESLLLFAVDTYMLQEVEQSIIEAAKRGVTIDLGLTENVEVPPLLEHLGTVKRVDCVYGLLVVDEQTLLDLYGTLAVLTQRPKIIRFTREYYNNPKCCTTMISQEGPPIPLRLNEHLY